MLFYLKGSVTHLIENKIILDVNGVGYQIYVSNQNQFPIHTTQTIYIHQVIKEEENYLVGFLTLEEKEFFSLMIKVQGLGPKGAVHALSKASPKEISRAIACDNITYLSSLPSITHRIATQMVFDLKNKIVGKRGNSQIWQEVRRDLRDMGFKVKEIEPVLSKIDTLNSSSEEVLMKALQMLRK